MKKNMDKVNTLIECLPYINDFYGKTIIVKYGGHAMSEENLRMSFAKDMVLMKLVGINPIIVHGGGPQINQLLNQLGIKSEFVAGMRVTDKPTMDVVEMVLVGQVNKEIVNNINQAGGKAVGLSGKDGGLITAEKIYHNDNGRQVDIGLVGTIKRINPAVLETLEKDMFIPVIAPIGVDENGITFNINADIAAGKIAEALHAEKLILLTDVEGVLVKGELVSTMYKNDIPALIKNNHITGGMIPKVNCCVDALDAGVGKTHIIDGRIEHAVLLEILTDAGVGTEIINSE